MMYLLYCNFPLLKFFIRQVNDFASTSASLGLSVMVYFVNEISVETYVPIDLNMNNWENVIASPLYVPCCTEIDNMVLVVCVDRLWSVICISSPILWSTLCFHWYKITHTVFMWEEWQMQDVYRNGECINHKMHSLMLDESSKWPCT